MRKFVHKQWKVCESIELNSSRHNLEITSMEFDLEGILLAVGDLGGVY